MGASSKLTVGGTPGAVAFGQLCVFRKSKFCHEVCCHGSARGTPPESTGPKTSVPGDVGLVGTRELAARFRASQIGIRNPGADRPQA